LSRAVKNGVPPPTRTGDDRVLVDQPGPHGRRGEGGAAEVQRPPSEDGATAA
jgi:hypothetical protein